MVAHGNIGIGYWPGRRAGCKHGDIAPFLRADKIFAIKPLFYYPFYNSFLRNNLLFELFIISLPVLITFRVKAINNSAFYTT